MPGIARVSIRRTRRIGGILRAGRARHGLRRPERQHLRATRAAEPGTRQAARQVRVVVTAVSDAVDLDRPGEDDELLVDVEAFRPARVTRRVAHHEAAGAIVRVVTQDPRLSTGPRAGEAGAVPGQPLRLDELEVRPHDTTLSRHRAGVKRPDGPGGPRVT
jgi:hypothetical protein